MFTFEIVIDSEKHKPTIAVNVYISCQKVRRTGLYIKKACSKIHAVPVYICKFRSDSLTLRHRGEPMPRAVDMRAHMLPTFCNRPAISHTSKDEIRFAFRNRSTNYKYTQVLPHREFKSRPSHEYMNANILASYNHLIIHGILFYSRTQNSWHLNVILN